MAKQEELPLELTYTSKGEVRWQVKETTPRVGESILPDIVVTVGADGEFNVALIRQGHSFPLVPAVPFETLATARAAAYRLYLAVVDLFTHQQEMPWKFSDGVWTAKSWTSKKDELWSIGVTADGRFQYKIVMELGKGYRARSLEEAQEGAMRREWDRFMENFAKSDPAGWAGERKDGE